MQVDPVTLHLRDPLLGDVARRAGEAAAAPGPDGAAPDLDAALDLARTLGDLLPHPGGGATLTLWSALATLGAADLTLARVVEPHLDALAILAEADRERQPGPSRQPRDATWGVFAAEGPGGRLHATCSAGSWTLTGHKPWCSLADRVSHALVTAWLDDERRGLFVVDLGHPGVRATRGEVPWAARGLTQVRSTGLDLDAAAATPVGEPGWYLARPGFAWGGIGVAAVWYGGAVAVARRLRQAALSRVPDQIALAHLGGVDVALARARSVLVLAADVVDGPVDGPVSDPEVASRLALRVRHVVADAAEETLERAGHALGPGPLAHEEEHARRVADLSLYLRQHHAERDAAALGATLLEPAARGEWSWW